jgi:hypothetical protein
MFLTISTANTNYFPNPMVLKIEVETQGVFCEVGTKF